MKMRATHRLGALSLAAATLFAAASVQGCGGGADEPDGGLADGAPGLDASRECSSGQTMCGSECVDLSRDPTSCGACGLGCEVDQFCVAGACRGECPDGQLGCGDGCFDPLTSQAHCGRCGTSCASGAVCDEGRCATECREGRAVCDGACRDLERDPSSCGACGNVCPEGALCEGATCVLSCGVGNLQCDDACVDPSLDPRHCGGCGRPCSDGEVCSEGACAPFCGAGLADCGDGACRDLAVDRAHCGACGAACDLGRACAGGACVPACGPGRVDCGGVCADLEHDPAHCGACGAACGVGQVCDRGACRSFCGTDLVDCGGACRDLNTDPESCGACGVRCAAGEVCERGACSPSCGAEGLACGGACVDPRQDPAHCGGCDVPCRAGEVCDGGSCAVACGLGLTECERACRDLSTDRGHCGGCGRACRAGEVCAAGACVPSCGGALIACGDVCVDPRHDRGHCGACGVVCPAGEVCADGVCAVSCGADRVDCAGACRDLETDEAHCGGCDRGCAPGEVCAAGACALSCGVDLLECGGACVDPRYDPSHCGGCGVACGADEVCDGGACARACPPGTTACGGGCRDLAVDPGHCGACEAACEAERWCRDGTCVLSCGAGRTPCGGGCIDPDRDPNHCGGCDAPCGAGLACSGGVCTMVCPSGQIACGAQCADLATDVGHCGACGASCAPGERCAGGTCERSCPPGQTECDGACYDTDRSPAHCGGCGRLCDPGSVCDAGSCARSCTGGAVECAGACVDLANDPEHCGACGAACAAPPGASPVCLGGGCRVVCAPDRGDCNGDLASGDGGDGCERDLSRDHAHCGACGSACDVADGAGVCDAGSCALVSCRPGFADCNGSFDDGCERQLTTDPMSCGACGVVCAPTQRCVGGACVSETGTGEDCSSPIVLRPGLNEVSWSASRLDYLTTTPACVSSGRVSGADLVLAHTATSDEHVRVTISKPGEARWVAVVSSGPCGALTPELACISDYAPPSMSGELRLGAGETAFFYLADTTQGAPALSNPLTIALDAIDCSASGGASVIARTPIDGTTTGTLSPTLEITFDRAIDPTSGTFSIVGDRGSLRTLDLSTAPDTVRFLADYTVIRVATSAFAPGERLSIGWTGILDARCGQPIPSPAWTLTMPAAPCTPGTGGMVGTRTSRIATALPTTMVERYLDVSATHVYVGSRVDLYRVARSGGGVLDVRAATGVGTGLGDDIVVAGDNLFAVNDSRAVRAFLWRLTRDGGATWINEDDGTTPMQPSNVFAAGAAVGDRLYLSTRASAGGVATTQLWWLPIDDGGLSTPSLATLEHSFDTELECNAIAGDDDHLFLACGGTDHLIRVERATSAVTVITSSLPLDVDHNEVLGHDLDGDGRFDVLYVQRGTEEVYFVCDPSGPTPYVDRLVVWGFGQSNHGLGLDPSIPALFAYDDDDGALIRVE